MKEKRTKFLKRILPLSAIIILASPVSVYANAGIPMIFISFPVMMLALLPVILIESGVSFKLLGVTFKKTLFPSAVVNTISTAGGFPLAWAFLLAFELLTTGGKCGPGFDTMHESIITALVESAWLCPWEDQFYWLIPTAFILCLLVAFFLSLAIEYPLLKRFYRNHDKRALKNSVYLANAVSYIFLILTIFGRLVVNIANKT